MKTPEEMARKVVGAHCGDPYDMCWAGAVAAIMAVITEYGDQKLEEVAKEADAEAEHSQNFLDEAENVVEQYSGRIQSMVYRQMARDIRARKSTAAKKKGSHVAKN